MVRNIRKVGATPFVAALFVALWFFFAPTQLGGSTTYTVTSVASMQPLLYKGDLAVIRSASTYKVGDVDLLLTGVFMPMMLGPEVAEKIHEIIPELRILYMSGYAQPVLGSTLRYDVALLEKPYSEEQLLAKIRDSIDRVS